MMAGSRITIMAGGTGGHVFPALAVANRLKELGCIVSWVGTARGIEQRLVPEAGYELCLIPVRGLRGKGFRSLILAPFALCQSLYVSLKTLSRLQPQLVLGFGGFVAGPVGLAARIQKRTLAIHEQNAHAGTTNKILAKWADRVMTGFPDVLPGGVCVGNPVRDEIRAIAKDYPETQNGPLRILVLGGSQGARALNQKLPLALALLAKRRNIEVRHQCGAKWLESTQECYAAAGLRAEVIPFITDISEAYQWSALVVCRAGAMTVAEIAAMGRPALFIPFPFAIDDHQTANARWLVNQGGAELIQESEINEQVLCEQLDRLSSGDHLKRMAQAALFAAKPDATDKIVQICEELIDVQ